MKKQALKQAVADLESGLESVKLNSSVVEDVRRNKLITGVPIGKFFEQAAIEKLKRQKSKK